MKFLKILLLVILSTVAGISELKAQNEPQIVLIRAVETTRRTSAIRSEMTTITPVGEKRFVALSDHNFTDYSEVLGKNGVIIQQEILKWQQQGFVITSFSTDGGDVIQRTFIIMSKE